MQPLRDRIRIAAAVFLCAALGAPLRAQDDAAVESPPSADRHGVMATALQPGVARGDFEFYVDALSQSPAGTGQTMVRCIVQLPIGVILDQTKANKADIRLRVRAYEAQAALQRLEAAAAATTVTKKDPKATKAQSAREASARGDEAAEDLLSDFGDMPVAGEAETRTQLEAADRSQLLETDFRIVEMALELPAADYVIEVAAENLSRRKRGLLDYLRRRPLAATAKLLVRVPDLRREPALADPAFLIGHGTRSPYATRLYGLLNDSLHVRTTIFGHGTHDLRVSATDRGGEVGWRDSLHLDVQGSRDVALATSVNQLPSGQYVLRVVVTGPQGTTSIARSFDVAWSLTTWKRSRRDFDLEAELALDEKRYNSYRSLPVGEKEKYLENFWRSIDPTPETAHNEVMDEFHRRVAHADLNFSEVIRGAMTDRGRVYVHFGPPDEIIAEAVPTHLAGEGGENALQKVDDVYVAEDQDRRTTFDRLGTDNQAISPTQRAAAQQERERLIGPANEVVSYEFWRYNGGGAPLMAEDKGMAVDTGLRVMFVDLDGYGRFIIRKSSVRLNIHGLTTSS